MADRKLEKMNELLDEQSGNWSNNTLGVMFAVLHGLVKYLISKENENEFSGNPPRGS